jgi:hypothetical protein
LTASFCQNKAESACFSKLLFSNVDGQFARLFDGHHSILCSELVKTSFPSEMAAIKNANDIALNQGDPSVFCKACGTNGWFFVVIVCIICRMHTIMGFCIEKNTKFDNSVSCLLPLIFFCFSHSFPKTSPAM